ncbi:hypothetical protein KC352_g38135 [Hortaea werneckii]|nr:hypothetical protein KC352_g38135 [Hortaea werneckii]
MALSGEQQRELEEQLQQAVIACNERCLYFAAKWSAELLNSFASQEDTVPDDDASDTDVDEPEDQASSTKPRHPDSKEKRLEAKELPRYLMANISIYANSSQHTGSGPYIAFQVISFDCFPGSAWTLSTNFCSVFIWDTKDIRKDAAQEDQPEESVPCIVR